MSPSCISTLAWQPIFQYQFSPIVKCNCLILRFQPHTGSDSLVSSQSGVCQPVSSEPRPVGTCHHIVALVWLLRPVTHQKALLQSCDYIWKIVFDDWRKTGKTLKYSTNAQSPLGLMHTNNDWLQVCWVYSSRYFPMPAEPQVSHEACLPNT